MIPNKKLMCILLFFNHRRPLYPTDNEIATGTLSDLAALLPDTLHKSCQHPIYRGAAHLALPLGGLSPQVTERASGQLRQLLLFVVRLEERVQAVTSVCFESSPE